MVSAAETKPQSVTVTVDGHDVTIELGRLYRRGDVVFRTLERNEEHRSATPMIDCEVILSHSSGALQEYGRPDSFRGTLRIAATKLAEAILDQQRVRP